jgi:hypothetical protein
LSRPLVQAGVADESDDIHTLIAGQRPCHWARINSAPA